MSDLTVSRDDFVRNRREVFVDSSPDPAEDQKRHKQNQRETNPQFFHENNTFV